MDQSILSSRAVIGAYYARLEANPGLAWVNGVSNLFESNQPIETYPWLGFSPSMREVVGGRIAKGLRTSSVSIVNKHYEATMDIAIKDLRRDKTGQLMMRIAEFADAGLTHWADQLSTLIISGETVTCYDGQFFFDTDHAEGDSGSQSNDIACDISEYPCQVHGTTTAPSVEEMRYVILAAISQILSFKNDRGQPMNENAREFLVKVPMPLYLTAKAAVATLVSVGAVANLAPELFSDFKVEVAMNPRLTWTTKIAVFRTDSPIKALIRQNETDAELKLKDETSEYAFDNFAIQIGIDAWRNVGFGYWQRACLATMT